jgi:hypothetical protein
MSSFLAVRLYTVSTEQHVKVAPHCNSGKGRQDRRNDETTRGGTELLGIGYIQGKAK